MKTLLSVGIMLLVSLRSFGAAGDITAIDVRADGKTMDVYVQGLSTNLAVTSGLATNGTPTAAAKCVLLVTSPGFDSTGTATTWQRAVFGTVAIRIPAVTNLEVVNAGSGVAARVALSHNIRSGDTIDSVTVLSGFLSDGGTNSNAGSVAGITNSSTIGYPIPIAKATEPGCRLMTNGLLRTVAFAQDNDDGEPVQCVWNIVTGVDSGYSVTNVASEMQIIRDRSNGLPAAEFATTTDLSTGFTDNERGRIDTLVFPKYGTMFYDTRSNLVAWPDARLCAFTNVIDPDDDYCRTAVIVDPAGVSGEIFDKATDPTTITNYYSTYAAAFAALQAANGTATGQTNIGGSIIYARNGATNYMGGTYTPNTTTPSRVFPWVVAYPGETPTITTRLTSNDPGDLMGFYGITFAITSAQVPFNAFNVLWLRNCHSFTCASTDPDVNVQQVWFDDCIVGSHSGGFKATTASSAGAYFVRNCNLDGYSSQSVCALFMGNIRTGTAGGTTFRIDTDRAGQTGARYEQTIWFNNLLEGNEASTEMATVAGNTNYTDGCAIVQNIFVKTGNPSLGPIVQMASGFTNSADSFIVWHNEFIGARMADLVSNNTWTNGFTLRENWSYIGNIVNGSTGWKLDTTAPADVDKFNLNSFGTGFFHNWYGEATTAEVAGNSFPPDFAGLWSYHPPDGGNNTNVIDAAGWRDYPELGTGGNGNYRKANDSVLVRQNPGATALPPWVLPFDIFGRNRTRYDPPGAVAASTR